MIEDRILAEAERTVRAQLGHVDGKMDTGGYVGGGAYKTVYEVEIDGESTGFIVKWGKGYEWHWGCVWLEWALYRRAAQDNGGVRPDWLPETVWGETPEGEPYMVQERCMTAEDICYCADSVADLEGLKESILHMAEKPGRDFGLSDLHDGNVGIVEHCRRPVVLDWGVVTEKWAVDRVEGAFYTPTTPAGEVYCAKEVWQKPEDIISQDWDEARWDDREWEERKAVAEGRPIPW